MTVKIIDKQTAEHYLWGDNCDSWVLTDTLPPGSYVINVDGNTTRYVKSN